MVPSRNDLVKAAKKADSTGLEQLLETATPATINSQSKTGETALYCAVHECRYYSAKALLEKGADPNLAQTTINETPLCLAVHRAQFEKEKFKPIIELLLYHKALFVRGDGGNQERAAKVKAEASGEILQLLDQKKHLPPSSPPRRSKSPSPMKRAQAVSPGAPVRQPDFVPAVVPAVVPAPPPSLPAWAILGLIMAFVLLKWGPSMSNVTSFLVALTPLLVLIKDVFKPSPANAQ